MNDEIESVDGNEEVPKTFVNGIDFYFEDGMMVLTRKYLLERGSCCDNGCRHCPYDRDDSSKQENVHL